MSAARLHKRAAKKAVAKKAVAKKKAARAKKAAKTPAKTKKTAPRANNAEKPGVKKIRAYRNKRQTRINIPDAGNAHEGKLRAPKSPKTQYQFDPHERPQLQWAGRAERRELNIQNLPLHVHERVDPVEIVRATLRKNGEEQPPLFETPGENLPTERAVEFYRHRKNWTNRFIAGDSLLVMNSLIEREDMFGRVQCVYMDPPYGIKYGSNFQPFVDKRDVIDGDGRDLTSEPEMIRAFRDTWELGVHSYLSYLRERLLLCRELLAKTGSCFVQISDENVHLVRCVMDEIFGPENHVSTITYKVTSGFERKIGHRRVHDFILWFAKDKENCKFNRLYKAKSPKDVDFNLYRHAVRRDMDIRRMKADDIQRANPDDIANIHEFMKRHRVFRTIPLHTMGTVKRDAREFRGEYFIPPPNAQWRHTDEMYADMVREGRVVKDGNRIASILFYDDFPYEELSSAWMDTGPETNKDYVVQTSKTPVQRCILSTTDPGDLVFDPTCGSGTSAFVAEQWGRRWITCDTSRVALAIARQRLITATFPYYRLWDETVGVDAGFALESRKRVTLSTVADGLPPETAVLHDRPKVDPGKIRVTGPFTMEAVPSPVTILVKSPEECAKATRGNFSTGAVSDDAIVDDSMVGDEESRRGATHIQKMWRVKFENAGIRLKGGRRMEVRGVRPYLADAACLHAVFETKEDAPKSGFVSFSHEHAPMCRRQVDRALDEAEAQNPRRPLLVFAAFEFDPEASRKLDEASPKGMTVLKVKMSPDIQTGDLKQSDFGSDAFWLMGSPDAELRQVESGEHKGKWMVRVRGFDYYNPVSGRLAEGISDDIAMWMLDTDYDGRSLRPRQVFFPLADGKRKWRKLAKNLRTGVNEELMERFAGKESLPFELTGKRVAVRIIDRRGIESLCVLEANS